MKEDIPWWTIDVSYDAKDDSGKSFRAKSVFQVQAETMREAYDVAQLCARPDMKFGAIMPGNHMRMA
jgi:hypothetical protein